ncbi:cytochrome c oxidase subunit II [Brevibacillus laterosporus]|uniref:cytochrome c oxidase subunit II n=1 Tax=Brevibacillus laterosporus TaxID=1465 RepID=UPI00264D0DE6|nr:cytochrome c oxidase subunit II [Brevibacillus laterosporus]MDN9009656.1 cytochrome c oxidase subunit II [Brevibacillus laterosporus]MDO0940345.1 cytochrome c oxidase subunit II [Brevibacillus laterosporus]
MHLHRFEKIWLMVGGATLVLFLIVLSVNAYAMGMMPPSHMKMIDPKKVDETAPFDNPGLHKTGDNEYDLVMTSFIFTFQPNQIEVPVGAKVKFVVTSKDVVHGFEIPKTNVNIMVLPGHISEVTHTFDKPGTYLILCNEYCGAGHQLMAATIVVK